MEEVTGSIPVRSTKQISLQIVQTQKKGKPFPGRLVSLSVKR